MFTIEDMNSRLFGQIMFDKPDDSGGNLDEITKLIANLGNKIDKVMPDEAIESLKSLAKRNNQNELDPIHKLLFNDNHSLREQARELKEKVLSDGQVAIDKDKVDLLSLLDEKEIKSKEDLEKYFKESDEARTQAVELKRTKTLDDVSDIYGTNSKVLSKLLGEDMEIEIAEVDEKGEKKKIANVVDSEGTKTEFGKYVDENLEEFKPSLFNKDQDGSTGRKWVSQSSKSSGSKNTSDKAKKFLENRKKRTSGGNALKKEQKQD